MTQQIAPAPPARSRELVVGGMTCAACAARVERKLNRLDGVEAAVSYATGRALVRSADDVEDSALVAAVLMIAAIWAIVQWLRQGMEQASHPEAPTAPEEPREP